MTFPAPYLNLRLLNRPMPFRLRVLRSLSEVIQRVNPDNGYTHDLRGNVFRGRQRFGADDPPVMVSILEAPIPEEAIDQRNAKSVSAGFWELLIQGWNEDDRKNPSDAAHYLMAEVKAVLASERVRQNGHDILGMGGRVVEMFIGQGTVRPPDDPTSEVFFWMTLRLMLAEDLENPYA